jgi:hypothetical protein
VPSPGEVGLATLEPKPSVCRIRDGYAKPREQVVNPCRYSGAAEPRVEIVEYCRGGSVVAEPTPGHSTIEEGHRVPG